MTVPFLVAHRGYARRYPENTLESVEAALRAGACFVEFDVQLTADCVPVLLHDADLSRTGNREEEILNLSLAGLCDIEVGQPQIFGDRFAGIRVPTLASVIELLEAWPRVKAFVEIKPAGIERFGVERVLERVTADLAAAPSRCIVISSIAEFLERARESGPWEIGLVLGDWSAEMRGVLERLRPEYAFCNLKRIPGVGDLWTGCWKWVIYEVVSPQLALELAARGVDFVETMEIAEMLSDPRLASRSCFE